MSLDKKTASIKRNCFDNALKLLFKYDVPTDEQVYHHLCTQNHCPTEHCSYSLGFRQGRTCEYVDRVKSIIKKLLTARNGD